MRRKVFFAALLNLVVAFVAAGQEFEVASIRPVQGKRAPSLETSPGGLTMRGTTLLNCIRWAWSKDGKPLRDYEVSGGPDWVRLDNFDIVTRSPKPATDYELRAML